MHILHSTRNNNDFSVSDDEQFGEYEMILTETSMNVFKARPERMFAFQIHDENQTTLDLFSDVKGLMIKAISEIHNLLDPDNLFPENSAKLADMIALAMMEVASDELRFVTIDQEDAGFAEGTIVLGRIQVA